METVAVTEEKVKKKRGRKPSKNRKGYFYEEQEQAVVDYISTDDEITKNKIYNKVLKPAFRKMVESIIRRYKLYLPDEEYQETFDDTLSFLMTKLSKFDPTKNYKAYSYCGTICKNYLFYKLNQFKKHQEKQESYDIMYESFTEDSNYIEDGFDELSPEEFVTELISNVCKEIQNIINEPRESNLTYDERRVGLALIDLFENWEELFNELGSNKFNKSSILLYLKDATNLTTPKIRNSMKKYKTAYYDIKKIML